MYLDPIGSGPALLTLRLLSSCQWAWTCSTSASSSTCMETWPSTPPPCPSPSWRSPGKTQYSWSLQNPYTHTNNTKHVWMRSTQTWHIECGRECVPPNPPPPRRRKSNNGVWPRDQRRLGFRPSTSQTAFHFHLLEVDEAPIKYFIKMEAPRDVALGVRKQQPTKVAGQRCLFPVAMGGNIYQIKVQWFDLFFWFCKYSRILAI